MCSENENSLTTASACINTEMMELVSQVEEMDRLPAVPAEPFLPEILETKPQIIEIIPDPQVPRTGLPFALILRFHPNPDAPAAAVHLQIEFPDGEKQAGCYRISPGEQAEGVKIFADLICGIWGTAKLQATLYAEDGSAASSYTRFDVVPENPFQVTVSPWEKSTSRQGAACYDEKKKRYYCQSKVVFSNGNNFPVTLKGPVKVKVTDGGAHVYSFSFNMGKAYTVKANSSITFLIDTFHPKGDKVAGIFDRFQDVTIELSFSTSQGWVSDYHPWIRMGQVKVACIFVGNFSWLEKGIIRFIVLGKASAIYEQENISITSAPGLGIPSSHPDWNRYRDIRIDECKGDYEGVISEEFRQLLSKWSSPAKYANHLDIFFVESFSGAACAKFVRGFAPRPGAASKSGPNSGAILKLKDTELFKKSWGIDRFAVGVAHEVGHYLGLKHTPKDSMNIMFDVDTTGYNTKITWDQHNTMVKHDLVQGLNP
ncbi:MAG: hypothetical protein KAW12_02400 [Candidatus Aminicenantes bacterium]|nr:hypothetical protein [Candidatus Aminicenantes bacterium]